MNNENKPKKWVQYDSEECPKCKTNTAHVLTRSTTENFIYDGEEARCFTCQHTGIVSVEDSECADIIWDDYNPQDNQKEDKEIRDIKSFMSEWLNRKGIHDCVSRLYFDEIFHAIKDYSKPLNDRIAELEAILLKVRDRHIKNPITYSIITKALSNEA